MYPKFCFARLYKDQKATTAVHFLQQLTVSFPHIPHKILTDNGLQFTYHKSEPTQHPFTKACREMDIEHRLTLPYHPGPTGKSNE